MEILGVVEIYSDFEDGIAGDAEVAAEGGHELLSGRLFFLCGKVFSFKKSVIMNRQHHCHVEINSAIGATDPSISDFMHLELNMISRSTVKRRDPCVSS